MILEIIILELGVPAWFCGIERLGYKLRPVLDRGGKVADVDNVKRFTEGPRLLAVVDFEFDVGGDPACETIHTKLDRPYPSPSSDVQHPAGIVPWT
ncbi:MAG: hypothetical protein Q9167_007491 [Letrouitia subvulpina]